MNEKTTIRFVLTGVKYSQSDLGKHYKTFCGLYKGQSFLPVQTGENLCISYESLRFLR